jgi:GTPase SAR1 family protein
MAEEYFIFRFILAGDGQVGKTSLIRQFCEEQKFDPKKPIPSTESPNHYNRCLWLNNTTCVKLTITDTPNSEFQNKLTSSSLKEMCCVLFVYDCTRKNTFDKLENLVETTRINNRNPSQIMGVVANKTDQAKVQVTS